MFKFQSTLFFLRTFLKHVKTVLMLHEPKPSDNMAGDGSKSLRNYASFNNLSGSEGDFNLFFKGFCRVETKINIGKIKDMVWEYFLKVLTMFETVGPIHQNFAAHVREKGLKHHPIDPFKVVLIARSCCGSSQLVAKANELFESLKDAPLFGNNLFASQKQIEHICTLASCQCTPHPRTSKTRTRAPRASRRTPTKT